MRTIVARSASNPVSSRRARSRERHGREAAQLHQVRIGFRAGRVRGGPERFRIEPPPGHQRRHCREPRLRRILAPPVQDDAAQLVDRVIAGSCEPYLPADERFHTACDARQRRAHQHVGIGHVHHRQQISFRGSHLLRADVRQSADRDGHCGDRSRTLLGAHRDLAGPDEQLQRDIDLLAGGVSGQRAAPKRLGDRERGVVRQAGDRQVLQQLGNQIAPFQPPEGSNRARRRRHVDRSRLSAVILSERRTYSPDLVNRQGQ